MELINDIVLEQRQILSQNQMQSLAVLAMNNQELSTFLQDEFLENPLFECINAPEPLNNNVSMDLLREKSSLLNKSIEEIKDISLEMTSEIRECIMMQLYHQTREKDEWDLIDLMIDCLDDNGYFTLKSGEVSQFLGYPEQLVKKCLDDLKELEPIGIFSENMSECLLKQLKSLEIKDEKLIKIVKDHLPDLTHGRVNAVARALRITPQEIRKYILIISKLNPQPGSIFSKSMPECIVPDVIVSGNDGHWVIRLNDKDSGEYKCNGYYLKLMKTSNDIELKKYLYERLERCRFVLNCIEQRRKTLLKVAYIVAEHQKEHFLLNRKLKPMSLSDIAVRAGVHLSTVSRAIKGKHIQYKYGTVLMRNLFSPYGMEENGQNVSTESVRSLIREIIESECKNDPLSDSEILKEIEMRGVKMSRRTIAKYRNYLGISDSHQIRYGL